MGNLLIKNGHLVDPLTNLDGIGDILIEGDSILQVGDFSPQIDIDEEIDASGLHVFPGFIDVHVHFRDPGFTHKEDIESGSRAALAGGVTSVIQMPNTSPALSTPELVREFTRHNPVHAYVAAAVTVDRAGTGLSNFTELIEAGTVAFTDDGSPINDPEIMRAALIESAKTGFKVMTHSENMELSGGASIIEGEVSEKLGVKGIIRDAESSMVERDINILRETDGHLHVQHVSTKRSVELIRQAKKEGLSVTAEVTPHHLLLNHEAVLKHGANAKMNPPLAHEDDRWACITGMLDNTLDIIATDHAPHSVDEKSEGLEQSPFGIVGIENSFQLLYTYFVKTGMISLTELVRRMSTLPAEMFNLPGGSLQSGLIADVAIFNLDSRLTIDPDSFQSKSKNTPFSGSPVLGKPMYTIVSGNIEYRS